MKRMSAKRPRARRSTMCRSVSSYGSAGAAPTTSRPSSRGDAFELGGGHGAVLSQPRRGDRGSAWEPRPATRGCYFRSGIAYDGIGAPVAPRSFSGVPMKANSYCFSAAISSMSQTSMICAPAVANM